MKTEILHRLLQAYDEQLRTNAEVLGALGVHRLGPLYLATYPGRGFITYRDLQGADPSTIAGWIQDAITHFRGQPDVKSVEWKTRAHDLAPGLNEALVAAGFVPDDPESIMIGEAAALAANLSDGKQQLPNGVTLRRVSTPADVRKMTAMQAEVFGDEESETVAVELLQRLDSSDGMQLWVADLAGEFICAGRLDPVEGTEFASVWGGATLPEWRGKGIYRALTAVRAKSALAQGKRWIHSDSTEFSRPILERAGLHKVSETTPYAVQLH
jgi:predicted N-acetyltransferase YhbS